MPLFNFWDVWSTVTVRHALLCQFEHLREIWVDFHDHSLQQGSCFLPFCMSANPDWMPDIVTSTLLRPRYLSVPRVFLSVLRAASKLLGNGSEDFSGEFAAELSLTIPHPQDRPSLRASASAPCMTALFPQPGCWGTALFPAPTTTGPGPRSPFGYL